MIAFIDDHRAAHGVEPICKVLPIAPADITRNDNFGRLISSFSQEGIDNRRTVRLRLRITF